MLQYSVTRRYFDKVESDTAMAIDMARKEPRFALSMLAVMEQRVAVASLTGSLGDNTVVVAIWARLVKVYGQLCANDQHNL